MRLALLALLAVAVSPHALRACSCVVEPSPKSAFQSAAAVFVGEVLASEGGTVRLRPLERFKGAQGEVVELRNDISTCEYGSLAPGSRHLIYAYEHLGSLTVSICSRSRGAERAACDLRHLRSRAGWWRSPLGRLRLLRRLGIRRDPCRNSA